MPDTQAPPERTLDTIIDGLRLLCGHRKPKFSQEKLFHLFQLKYWLFQDNWVSEDYSDGAAILGSYILSKSLFSYGQNAEQVAQALMDQRNVKVFNYVFRKNSLWNIANIHSRLDSKFAWDQAKTKFSTLNILTEYRLKNSKPRQICSFHKALTWYVEQPQKNEVAYGLSKIKYLHSNSKLKEPFYYAATKSMPYLVNEMMDVEGELGKLKEICKSEKPFLVFCSFLKETYQRLGESEHAKKLSFFESSVQETVEII